MPRVDHVCFGFEAVDITLKHQLAALLKRCQVLLFEVSTAYEVDMGLTTSHLHDLKVVG